jgi:prenyltransferase beta subunit
MRSRRVFLSFALASLCAACACLAAPLPRPERRATLAYLQNLQNDDGGYRPAADPGPSMLTATVPAVRGALHLGSRPGKREATVRFVMSCYDSATGAFADTPGGKADVRSTAMGLIALTELGAPLPESGTKTLAFFEEKARSIPELYIAEAALQPSRLTPLSADRWLAAFEATRTADGGYGSGPADTARAVVTRLRLGREVPETEKIVRLLCAAQRPDGGFPGPQGTSDLSAAYPIVRALFMLKAKPDLGRLRSFVGSCRNADGGYGAVPGQPSTGSATYFAAIILDWAEQLDRG